MENDEYGIENMHLLNKGGQGTIYLARSVSLETNVIVKEFNKGDVDKERRIMCWDQPNIIKCFGQWNLPNHLIYEYVSKGDLESVISKEYHLLKLTPLKHIEGILNGLDYIHQKNVVHLDLHSKNILVHVDNAGNLIMKICDFGLSADKDSGHFIQPIKGRPGYVSPEKIYNGAINTDSDIWSFAVIVWKLLTTREAYNFDNECAMYYTIGNKKHPDVPLKWPILIQKLFFQCWDSRESTNQLLLLFENQRIKSDTEKVLADQMPLDYYLVYVEINPERVVSPIEWNRIDKTEIFRTYPYDKSDFENIKFLFGRYICQRKYRQIKSMMDLLQFLNECGHFTNLKELESLCIGPLCKKKKHVIEKATVTQLVKFARVLGIPDILIDSLKTQPSAYFAQEIFEFWTHESCNVPFDSHNFIEIEKRIGMKIP